jgi:hypothetical protein
MPTTLPLRRPPFDTVALLAILKMHVQKIYRRRAPQKLDMSVQDQGGTNDEARAVHVACCGAQVRQPALVLKGFFLKRRPIGRLETQRLGRKFQNDSGRTVTRRKTVPGSARDGSSILSLDPKFYRKSRRSHARRGRAGAPRVPAEGVGEIKLGGCLRSMMRVRSLPTPA